MDFEIYKNTFFTDPTPVQQFEYVGLNGITLYFSDFLAAIYYYERVLGPPTYAEREETRGWRIGNSWRTLLKSDHSHPENIDVTFLMASPEEAERIQAVFIEQGGEGSTPSDELMYEPIRFCSVQDPFGTNILVMSPLDLEA